MKIRPRVAGFLLTITAGIIWGINGTLVQFLIGQRGMNTEWLVTLRLLLPGLLLLGGSTFSPAKRPLTQIWQTRKDARALLTFSIGLAAVQYTFVAAIEASNAATATIIQYIAPVMIAAYYAWAKQKWPTAKETIALMLALLGTWLLATKGDPDKVAITGVALFWALLSAVALAFYSIQPLRLLKDYPTNLVTGWGMLLGGIGFSFIHAPWQVSGRWDGYAIGYFAFLILFGSLLAFSFYLQGVKLIGSYISTLLTSFEPLTATLVSILWLHLSFGLAEILGSLCIIITVFLLSPGDSSAELTHQT